MSGTTVKRVMLKIVADDGDTEVKLDRISEKAGELGRLHPELKVRIDSRAATAKVEVLRRELAAAARDAHKITLKERLGGAGSGLANLAGIPGGSVSEMSMMQKAMLGLNVATGLGEPLIAGMTVAVGGLAAGLASAWACSGWSPRASTARCPAPRAPISRR